MRNATPQTDPGRKFPRLCYNLPVPSPLIVSIVAVAAAYLLGSVSWAYVIGRLVRGIDMTEVGDARIGAAFSMRKLGTAWGMMVGLMDFSKGVASVTVPVALGLPEVTTFLCGAAVVAGHNWSLFLNFKGGRGAAATIGVLAVIAFIPMIVAGLVLLPPLYATRGHMFIRGIRRTTLLFGVWMGTISLLSWLDAALGFLPAPLWGEAAFALQVGLPLCLFVLNILKSPAAGDGR